MKLLKKFAITATIAASFMAIFSSCNNVVVESEAKTASINYSNNYNEDNSYQKAVIYQLFVDRFYDGDSSNNYGNNSAMYSSSKSDWKKYWGGDLAGMNEKLDYLKEMGINSIWVSPLVDCVDELSDSGDAPFHGYWGKNFFNIDEHNGTWQDFNSLVSKMHNNDYNMKLILDYAPNHSSANDEAEFGALYKSSYDANGNLLSTWKLTSYPEDTAGNWYHRYGGVGDDEWDDPWKCRYKNLFNLSDFNQDNETTYSYLADGLEFWLRRGVDAVRLDAVKHMNTSFTTRLVSDMRSRLNKDIFFFGEWMDAGAWATGLNVEGQDFEHNSGCNLLDFGYRTTMENVLKNNATMRTLASYLSDRETYWSNPLRQVVFLDNHDMPRINTVLRYEKQMSESYAARRTDLGLAITMTIRGVPCIYYGTEHYSANFTMNSFGQVGSDPYNREMMPSFNTNTSAFNIIKTLANLKQTNKALQDGSYAEKWQEDNIIAYERKSGNDVVFVVANKGYYQTLSIPNVNLPNGQYANVLAPNNKYTVTNKTAVVSLGENEVIVLAYTDKVADPVIESITPDSGSYNKKQTVTITTNNDSNTIYYTLDGTTPTSASAVYTGAFTLSEDATLKAIAYNAASDTPWSEVVTREYVIDIPPATDLTVHVMKNSVANWSNFNCYFWASDGASASNTWPGSAMIQESENWYTYTIDEATEANVIFNNGSSQTVDLSASGTDTYFVPTGWSNGKITGTWYTYNPYPDIVYDPVVAISLASGTYSSAQTVTISSTNSSDVIYYTLDGTTPTAASTVYTSALTISASTTLKAISFNSAADTQWSSVESRTYTIELPPTNGTLTINFIAGGNSENISIPGDFNGWNLNSTTASVNANGSTTFIINNAVTSGNIALGNSTSKLELKLVTNASWNNQWSFGSWTKTSNISLSDGNRQIAIDVQAGQDVTLTINVATLSLSAEIQ